MWSLIVYAVALVAGGVLFWRWDDFREHTHAVAAILTFVCFGAVAFINGWLRPENTGRFLATYRAVTIGMVVAFALFLLLRITGNGFRTDVFWLEAVEISLFATFWLAQTIQHWHEADP
jgi:drug/metabolite transporter superfamily protein YnfA